MSVLGINVLQFGCEAFVNAPRFFQVTIQHDALKIVVFEFPSGYFVLEEVIHLFKGFAFAFRDAEVGEDDGADCDRAEYESDFRT